MTAHPDTNSSLYDTIETVAAQLYVLALTRIPPDIRAALAAARETEQEMGNRTAGRILNTILNNIEVADRDDTLVCQDTGLPIYQVVVGGQLRLDLSEVQRRIERACRRITLDYPLRPNCVHPLNRRNTGTNTGQGIPIVLFEFEENSEEIRLRMAPKGSGSENMSFLRMLDPAEGVRGIRRFVLECVFESGARPCPPVIVGVGLGGTADLAMKLAKQASTFRLVGSQNADPEIADLERDLLDRVNRTGLGPQGLGGATTALAVHVEWAHTHISQNPVAVNMQCWRGERAEAVIGADGTVRTTGG